MSGRVYLCKISFGKKVSVDNGKYSNTLIISKHIKNKVNGSLLQLKIEKELISIRVLKYMYGT